MLPREAGVAGEPAIAVLELEARALAEDAGEALELSLGDQALADLGVEGVEAEGDDGLGHVQLVASPMCRKWAVQTTSSRLESLAPREVFRMPVSRS